MLQRTSIKISGLMIILVAAAGFWFLQDESLMIEAPHQKLTSPISYHNGFIYLLGFDNTKGDPFTTGHTRLQKYRQALLHSPPQEINIAGAYYLRAPEWFEKDEAAWWKQRMDLRYVVLSNQHLLSRYQSFLQYDEFDTLLFLTPTQSENLLSGIEIGNRLLRADVMAKAAEQQEKSAAILLTQDIQLWRRQLMLADTFVHKWLAARVIAHDLSLLRFLLVQKRWSTHSLDLFKSALSSFSVQEISLKKPFTKTELDAMAYYILRAKQEPELISIPQASKFARQLFKPNMTVNLLRQEYAYLGDESELPPKQIFDNMQNRPPHHINLNLAHWLKNPIGNRLVEDLTISDFRVYTARLWDLDINRLLTLLLIDWQQAHDQTKTNFHTWLTQTRYLGTWNHSPPTLDKKTSQVCYDGPFEDKKQLRCLGLSSFIKP